MGHQKIAIIMDSVERIDIERDTTFALALEAQSRDFELWHVDMNDIRVHDTTPWSRARKVEFVRQDPCFRWMSDPASFPMDEFDTILIRTDPPFNERYFYATHFLSLCQRAKVVNRPLSIRDAPEKIYSLRFPDIIPPTLITSNSTDIRRFMETNGGEIIIKPLNQCGGAGVIYLSSDDRNFNSIMEISTKNGSEYIIAQKYLSEIREGDKRVICVNGSARGAILRIPDRAEHRGNIHVGANVVFSELSERDNWLVERIQEKLREDGLYFVGLDIIGDYITEINVTSPTGIQEIFQQGHIDIAKMFWDELSDFH